MNKYKLIISYDGTDYFGWQSQKKLPAVASALERSFATIFNTTIVIRGASRTDAGVHALGQVASFKTDLTLEPEKMRFAWNNALPPSIFIRSIESIPLEHSIYDNIQHKTYHYYFFTQRPYPFVARYGYYYYKSLDLAKMAAALQLFVGTHDFRSFCSSEDTRENTVRTIYAISLEHIKRYNVYRVTITGTAFLRHMIRRIVGASLEIAHRSNLPIETVSKVLAEKNPLQMLPNAPAQGLLLYKIRYKQ